MGLKPDVVVSKKKAKNLALERRKRVRPRRVRIQPSGKQRSLTRDPNRRNRKKGFPRTRKRKGDTPCGKRKLNDCERFPNNASILAWEKKREGYKCLT